MGDDDKQDGTIRVRDFTPKQSFFTIVIGQNGLLREGLVSILRAAGFSMLDPACSVSDLDLGVWIQEQSQSLLIIVAAGDDLSAAFEALEQLQASRVNGNVVVVAERFRLNDVISSFQRGAKAYFFTHTRPAVLIKSLELVMMGETIVPHEFLLFAVSDVDDYSNETKKKVNRMVTDDNREYEDHRQHLSNREKTILQCLITGDTNKTIARKINIAEATVKVHIKAILRKVQVQNRTQAAVWAMQNESIDGQRLDLTHLNEREVANGGNFLSAVASA